MILYEHPFNERTRFMIRLEYLFQQLLHFSRLPQAEYQHVVFAVLFQLMDVCERGDCRNWVLQEIEKQKTNLESYRDFPEIDDKALDAVMQKLSAVTKPLASCGKLGSHIRENDWLMSLRNRFTNPGTTSPMDCPSYSAWLNIREVERVSVLENLIQPFLPLYETVQQVLDLLRSAAVPEPQSSKVNGVFEKAIGGKTYQMIRVWVPANKGIYPEISGNKHVVMIRFFKINERFRQQLLTEPLGFKMALCQV